MSIWADAFKRKGATSPESAPELPFLDHDPVGPMILVRLLKDASAVWVMRGDGEEVPIHIPKTSQLAFQDWWGEVLRVGPGHRPITKFDGAWNPKRWGCFRRPPVDVGDYVLCTRWVGRTGGRSTHLEDIYGAKAEGYYWVESEQDVIAKGDDSEMRIKPLYDRALVRRDESPEERGGILTPEIYRETMSHGTVIAVGDGAVDQRGERIPVGVSEGDRISFSRFAGIDLPEIEGHPGQHLVLRTDEILALIP